VAVVVAAPGKVARRAWQWKWRILVVGFVVGLTALALYLNMRSSLQKVPAAPVSTAKPILAEAWVVPTQERKLAFQTSGLIKQVTVGVGDKVKAGAIIAALETSDLQLKVDEAQTNLALQKALIAQSAEPPTQTDLNAAQVALDSALAHQKEVEGGAAADDIKAAKEAVAVAQAGVDNAQALLKKATAEPTASDIASAEAAVRSAEAAQAAARQTLDDAKAKPKPEDVAAANLGVEQAKNSLWSQQVARDATCGTFGSNSTQCQGANASVAAAETAVKSAQASLIKAQQPATADEITADQSAVTSADAGVASANEHLAQVKAGSTAADRDAATAQVDQAKANLRSAQAKLDQLQGGSTASDREAARSAVEQARANLAKLTEGPSPATLDVSSAKLKQAEVTLAEAQLALDNATIRAPFDGEVTSIALKVGDYAAPGTAVLTLADLSGLHIETKDLDEVSAAKVQVGEPVQVTIPALDKKTFAGTVTQLDREPTVTSSGDVNYVARISLTDTPADLRWGQSARVEFR
jgi:HlyD family secretion protein